MNHRAVRREVDREFEWERFIVLHTVDPVGKAKSVTLSEIGEQRARELFEKLFCD